MNIQDFIKDNTNLAIKKFNPKKEGYIYFICSKQGVIIYIGSTCNMNGRIAIHKQKIQFVNRNFYFFPYPAHLCLAKEAELIETLRPKYNRAYRGIYTESNKYHSLKVALKKKGITQTSLAKQIGVTRQTVSLILNGQICKGETQRKVKKLIEELLIN